MRPLPIASEAWLSRFMDFILGLSLDIQGRTSKLVFAGRFSKMSYLFVIDATVTTAETAAHFIDAEDRYGVLMGRRLDIFINGRVGQFYSD